MIAQAQNLKSFLTDVAPWIRGCQIAVYLHGREKPMTGLTVAHVGPRVLVARWNSSTHLIPLHSIACIRFSPDSEPCRNLNHPLHSTLSDAISRDPTTRHFPRPPRTAPPADSKRATPDRSPDDPNTVPIAAGLADVVNRLRQKGVQYP